MRSHGEYHGLSELICELNPFFLGSEDALVTLAVEVEDIVIFESCKRAVIIEKVDECIEKNDFDSENLLVIGNDWSLLFEKEGEGQKVIFFEPEGC